MRGKIENMSCVLFFFSQQDFQNSVVAELDAVNDYVVMTMSYDAYGNMSVTNLGASYGPPEYAFQGQRQDFATGLYEMGARYYDPTTGRWTSQDPIGFDGGDPNFYRFVINSPTNATDPAGLWSWSGAFGGAATGGGTGAGVGALAGLPFAGVGAAPGALIGGGIGGVGGFILGGIYGEDVADNLGYARDDPNRGWGEFFGGGILGVPAGIVGGLAAPFVALEVPAILSGYTPGLASYVRFQTRPRPF